MKKLIVIVLLALAFAAPSLAQVEIRLAAAVSEGVLESYEALLSALGVVEVVLRKDFETHCQQYEISGDGQVYIAVTCVLDDKIYDREIIFVSLGQMRGDPAVGNGVLLFHDGQLIEVSQKGSPVVRPSPLPGRYDVLFAVQLMGGDELYQMSFDIE